MAEVLIYHNPNCSTSKHAVALAESLGVDAEVNLYLKTKPDRAELESLIAKLEDPPTDLVRRDAFFAAQGLSDADVATDEQVIDILVAHPRLLQRPVLVRGDRAIVGRPKDRVGPFLS